MDRKIFLEKYGHLDLGQILFNEEMKNHTSFKIGGPVDIMILPENQEQIINAIRLAKEENFNHMIMGNGSNLLVSDKGIRGLIIKIGENLNEARVEGNTIFSQAGARLNTVSRLAQDNSLTGLEFANGIPGTLGGALAMNAGAYGGEMKDHVKKVQLINRELEVIELSGEEMNFRYRGSRALDEKMIIIGAEIVLSKGNKEEIDERMKDLTMRRRTKQPLDLASGGSTFKRPEGNYAGKLIEEAGLKGLRYGGAQVSEKHSGFIVNIDQATCQDVVNLIGVVQKAVLDKFGVKLEPEIRIIGDF